jgi:nucleoside-diphosphate-sugar epimerase
MTTHLVLGAGPVGSAIAELLVAHGEDVVLASRSGNGPALPGVTRTAVEAADPDAVTQLARGSSVIYNALNPTGYHRWHLEWPPLWAALTAAAEESGALLATVGNLYPYGLPDGPLREDTPERPRGPKARLRAQMWADAERAHREGRFPALEVRASDYVGPGAVSTASMALEAAMSGRTVRVVGRADLPHSWTYPADVAALVVAAAADPRAHGRLWHVPTNPPVSQGELVAQVAEAAGAPAPTVRTVGAAVLRLAGLGNPQARAVAEVTYQYTRPFVIDDTAARTRFGLSPTPWVEVVARTAQDLLTHPLSQDGAAR